MQKKSLVIMGLLALIAVAATSLGHTVFCHLEDAMPRRLKARDQA
jgi:hypothetical protein